MKLLEISAAAVIGLALLACNNAKSDTASAPPAQTAAALDTDTDTGIGLSPEQIDVAMRNALRIDPERCWRYVKEFVESSGSRPLGSPGHRKAEDYIHSHLKGDAVEDDSFTQHTPVGDFPVRNIIARYPGKKPGIVVFASHYETNIWL